MKGKIKTLLAALLGCCMFVGCAPIAGVQSGSETESGSLAESESAGTSEEIEVTNYWTDKRNFGIHVTEDGEMTLAEEKLYAAGVNCYNLFNQCFGDGYSETKAKETLDILASYGVKVVRFNCGGYLHSYIGDYYANKKPYVDLLVKIAEYAETLEIGLIPSFFWLHHAVPDHYDEPIRSWGRSDSNTVAFLREYTYEIVRALKDHKAIFAWEFGNEFNLSCDLPNAAEHMPALPAGSSRTERTEEDHLSATDVNYAISEFSRVILELDDSGRMITSGNATLRPSQYNQLHYNTWTQDTLEEYGEITAMFTPDGVDTVCEHVYFTSQKTFGEELTLAEYLSYATATAKKLKKAYFVGEWGGGSSTEYAYYRGIGNAFVNAGVQLALLWNFNAVEGTVEYSFSAQTERGRELLAIVGEMNDRYENEY